MSKELKILYLRILAKPKCYALSIKSNRKIEDGVLIYVGYKDTNILISSYRLFLKYITPVV